uniref:Putative secreted protein n=1 Tax=Ixodes ricinus TaxID=34613 RepID=A0A147BSG2_IXORI
MSSALLFSVLLFSVPLFSAARACLEGLLDDFLTLLDASDISFFVLDLLPCSVLCFAPWESRWWVLTSPFSCSEATAPVSQLSSETVLSCWISAALICSKVLFADNGSAMELL